MLVFTLVLFDNAGLLFLFVRGFNSDVQEQIG